jgi:DNA-binding phage protein
MSDVAREIAASRSSLYRSYSTGSQKSRPL